jgi:hypothetical protein
MFVCSRVQDAHTNKPEDLARKVAALVEDIDANNATLLGDAAMDSSMVNASVADDFSFAGDFNVPGFDDSDSERENASASARSVQVEQQARLEVIDQVIDQVIEQVIEQDDELTDEKEEFEFSLPRTLIKLLLLGILALWLLLFVENMNTGNSLFHLKTLLQ